jgi:RNA polymerase sigma-70 factor (ECF subfamily)
MSVSSEIVTSEPQQQRAPLFPPLRPLDPGTLPQHMDALYRAAWALCGSPHEAEDLVQDTFVQVLRRPRLIRSDDDLGYLLRALRNTHATRHRAAMRRPITARPIDAERDARTETGGRFDARELMAAIAAAPEKYRDAVVAVDILGLSYRQAARRLRTREATLTSRLARGRQHIALALGGAQSGSDSRD